MLPVTAAFQAAVKGTHVADVKVDAYYNGVLIASRLPLVDGTVTIDGGGQVRRTFSATIADQALFPVVSDYTDQYAPYGTQYKIFRGVVYPTGKTEWCQLGTFRLDSMAEAIEPGTLKVTGSDLSKVVQDSRFLSPTATLTSNRVPVEIARHLRGSTPTFATLPVRDLTGSVAMSPKMTWDRDRWQGLTDLALSVGAEIVFGVDGTALIQPVPVITNAVVWTVRYDEILITGERAASRDKVYNAVVATGERTDNVAPARGVAQDTNPSSATWVGGPYGVVPVFYSSPVLTTNAAALKAAQTILDRVRGLTRQVQFECLPNPAVDSGDVMNIVFPDGSTERHIVDSIQFPLSVTGSMRVTTRTTSEESLS